MHGLKYNQIVQFYLYSEILSSYLKKILEWKSRSDFSFNK